MKNILSVPEADFYETPLGRVPVDRDAVNQLLKNDIFRSLPEAHLYEHSVQMEIPFLQVIEKEFRIVPIVIGSCDETTLKKAAVILKKLLDRDTLLIASSDFVHYGPNYNYIPFREKIPENLRKLNFGAYNLIEKCDSAAFMNYVQKTGATICGRTAIALLLSVLPPGTKVRKLYYTTSGKLTGDYTNSVCYMSIAFTGKYTGTREKTGKNKNSLTDDDKKTLLKLARSSLIYFLKKRKIPAPEDLGIKINGRMKVERAAFVTLKKGKYLRGCIGEIFPRRPLYKSVIINAVNAGVNDSRFRPVKENELKDITFEISALTPPEQVSSYKDIKIGTDGMVLMKGGYSAVYLPQVAPEQGWNIEQTLTSLSRKAGLPPDAWKKGAAFLTFQADVFGE
jgi:AmmeMemoRadiSam system protein A/AmmeMemoRadiSam system protein B